MNVPGQYVADESKPDHPKTWCSLLPGFALKRRSMGAASAQILYQPSHPVLYKVLRINYQELILNYNFTNSLYC